MDIIIATSSADLRIALELLIREEADISVTGTTNKTEGLCEWIETNRPDLLLLDWELVGNSSTKILGTISRLTLPPKIIVIAENESIEEVALKAGADSLIQKGYSRKGMLESIREIGPE